MSEGSCRAALMVYTKLWSASRRCPVRPALTCDCRNLSDGELVALLRERFAGQQLQPATPMALSALGARETCEALQCGTSHAVGERPLQALPQSAGEITAATESRAAAAAPVTVHGAAGPVTVTSSPLLETDQINYASRSDGARVFAADQCAVPS